MKISIHISYVIITYLLIRKYPLQININVMEFMNQFIFLKLIILN